MNIYHIQKTTCCLLVTFISTFFPLITTCLQNAEMQLKPQVKVKRLRWRSCQEFWVRFGHLSVKTLLSLTYITAHNSRNFLDAQPTEISYHENWYLLNNYKHIINVVLSNTAHQIVLIIAKIEIEIIIFSEEQLLQCDAEKLLINKNIFL